MTKLSEGTCGWMASFGLLLIRLATGLCIAAHGYGKLFGEKGIQGFAGYLESMHVPAPTVMAYMSGGVEFVCGIFIALGLLTRVACVPLVLNMLVAVFLVHFPKYFLPEGMEYALNLAVVYAGLALLGPGQFSVDRILCGRCGKKP